MKKSTEASQGYQEYRPSTLHWNAKMATLLKMVKCRTQARAYTVYKHTESFKCFRKSDTENITSLYNITVPCCSVLTESFVAFDADVKVRFTSRVEGK